MKLLVNKISKSELHQTEKVKDMKKDWDTTLTYICGMLNKISQKLEIFSYIPVNVHNGQPTKMEKNWFVPLYTSKTNNRLFKSTKKPRLSCERKIQMERHLMCYYRFLIFHPTYFLNIDFKSAVVYFYHKEQLRDQ